MAKGPRTEGEPPTDQEPLLSVLGARVREARMNAKLKQSELGAAIGSNQSYIFLVESGQANVTLKNLARIADALGVNPKDLLSEGQTSRELGDTDSQQLAELVWKALREAQATAQSAARTVDLLQRIRELVTGHPGSPSIPPHSGG